MAYYTRVSTMPKMRPSIRAEQQSTYRTMVSVPDFDNLNCGLSLAAAKSKLYRILKSEHMIVLTSSLSEADIPPSIPWLDVYVSRLANACSTIR